MSKRKKIPKRTQTSIFVKSMRRCALCYCLEGNLKEELGQIAHLDEDPSNHNEDNLMFMCLKHHSLYDSETSQHKNYTIWEVKEYRKKLHEVITRNERNQITNRAFITQTSDTALNEAQKFVKEAADGSISASSLVRKAIIIAKKRNDTAALEWLDQELNGYDMPAQNLPTYRKLRGEPYIYHRYRAQWEAVQCNNEAHTDSFTSAPNIDPIASIEKILEGRSLENNSAFAYGSANIKQSIREALEYPMVAGDAHIRVSPSSLHNILEAVRNRIFEWSLTL